MLNLHPSMCMKPIEQLRAAVSLACLWFLVWSQAYLAYEEVIVSREPIARSQISNQWKNRIDNLAEFH
jgi:hypothetical protein